MARQYAATEGWAFHMVAEKELLPGSLLSNVQLVGRYRQASTDPAPLTVQRLVSERGVPLADLCRKTDRSNLTRARMHIFHLWASGDQSFDPRKEPISDQTLIYPGGVITMGKVRLGVGTDSLLDGRRFRMRPLVGTLRRRQNDHRPRSGHPAQWYPYGGREPNKTAGDATH